MQNIYLFHGEDSYTSNQKSLYWQKEFEKKYGDLNSEIFDGEDLTAHAFTEAVNTLPFLSDKKFVVVKNAFAQTPTEELKKIAEKIDQIPEHCVVIFVERKKADLRTSLYKQIKKHGQALDFNPMDTPDLIKWILTKAQKKQANLNHRAAGYLAETVGPNLWQMSHEIEKLALNTNGREITHQDIDELTSPNLETTIFKLTDNLSLKRRKESLKTLKTLIDSGENLIPTLYAIAAHFRTVIQVKDCATKNIKPPAIIKTLKKHPFVVNKAISQSKNFTEPALKNIYKQLLQIDINMKTGKIKMTTEDQTELRLSLEKLIANFCR